MPIQTKSQKIGTLGQSIVELQVKTSGYWISRNLTEDYGVDLELEYAPEQVKGKFIKVQIKTQEKVSIKKGAISVPLKKSFLRYSYECKLPIVLIVVSLENSNTWYVWLQQWLVLSNNVSNIYDDSSSKKINVQVDEKNDFKNALRNTLIPIATGENGTQLLLGLKELANLSLKMHNSELSESLFRQLERFNVNNISDENYLSSLITQVLELGANLWATSQGNKVAEALFDFVRLYGIRLTANHIAKIVLRGDSYSRTGIIAMGILYEEFPDHALSLRLIDKFAKAGNIAVEYYCAVRERHINMRSPEWILKGDLNFKNLKPNFLDVSVWDKWANRGDSMILDYLEYINEP